MFKISTILPLLALSFTLMSEDVPVAMPLDIEKGMVPYQSRINAKIIEVNKIRMEEIAYLEKSLKTYIQKTADLDGAGVIKSKIASLKAEIDESDPVKKTVMGVNDQIVGTWKNSIEPTYDYELKSDNSVSCSNGAAGNWSIKDGFVVITWNGGGWIDKFKINTVGDSKKHPGSNNNGRTYEFTKKL